MIGKASLLLILGFSLIFLVFGHRFGSLTNQAVDNMTNYYAETVSQNCADAGANMAANKVFLNNKWRTGFSNLSFNGGEINVNVQNIYSYGDSLIKITSQGICEGITHKSVVLLRPSSFSKFAYYSIFENDPDGNTIWWMAKDTVWGPFHTQDYMHVDNHPVFHGKVTTGKSNLIYKNNEKNDYPVIDGDFQTNIDLPLPYDGIAKLKSVAKSGGKDIPQSSTTTTTTTGHGSNTSTTTTTNTDTVYITFIKDSIQIKMGIAKPAITYKTSEFSPNGVIFAEGMDIHLQGTLQGQYTIGSDENIYLDGNIEYNTDPQTDPTSTNILGICAQKNVLIADNTKKKLDINIDAAIYCQEAGFGVENYDKGAPKGIINLLGGITQYIRQPVGLYSVDKNGKSKIEHGYSKRYRYDNRLSSMSPPFYPNTGKFEVVSWLEE